MEANEGPGAPAEDPFNNRSTVLQHPVSGLLWKMVTVFRSSMVSVKDASGHPTASML